MSSIEIKKTIDFFGLKDGIRRVVIKGVPFDKAYRAIFNRNPRS